MGGVELLAHNILLFKTGFVQTLLHSVWVLNVTKKIHTVKALHFNRDKSKI